MEYVEKAKTIETSLKLYQKFGIEKWLLRKAFESCLPSEIVWRNKMEFAHGCASSTFLESHAENTISDQAFAEAQSRGAPVSTKEELLYFRIFQNHFPDSNALALVGMWDKTLH